MQQFSLLRLNEEERVYATQEIAKLRADWNKKEESLAQSLHLRLGQLNERLGRLTDAYIDRVIEKDIFEERKAALLMNRREVEERMSELDQQGRTTPDLVAQFLELAGIAYTLYKSSLPEEKRDLLKTITSNRQVEGKRTEFMLALPFAELANRSENTNGGPYRDVPRTFGPIFQSIYAWFQTGQRINTSKENS